MTGASRSGFAVLCVAAGVAIFACLPRFEDIPCARDENCSEKRPYCVKGRCSTTPGSPDPADAGKGLGEPCLEASQCASGHCANGVCCDTPCDAGECQRCDGLSRSGPGHCDVATAEAECQVVTNGCDGKCRVHRTVHYCTGNSTECSARTASATGPVASGRICDENGVPSVRLVSPSAFCSVGVACEERSCQGARWWTSCNGTGDCRPAGDLLDAYEEPFNAPQGLSWTSGCGMSTQACADPQCVGDVLSDRFSCDNAGRCVSGATTSCGGFKCEPTALQCKIACASDSECAEGWLCAPPKCHWNWDWVAWDLGGMNSYATSGGTVRDGRSGLMWQQGTSDGGMSWNAGLGYCDTLALGGHTDWRLPKAIELLSIVESGRTNPAIDTSVFPGTPSADFWTSTPAFGRPGAAWTVHFYFGNSGKNDAGVSNWVRCVRSW